MRRVSRSLRYPLRAREGVRARGALGGVNGARKYIQLIDNTGRARGAPFPPFVRNMYPLNNHGKHSDSVGGACEDVETRDSARTGESSER